MARTMVTTKKVTKTKSPSHPSYKAMASEAITELKMRKGASRQAIKKYILSNYKNLNLNLFASALRKALNKGVEEGLFVQNKQSFKLNPTKMKKKPAAAKAKKTKAKKPTTKKKTTTKKKKTATKKKTTTKKKKTTKKSKSGTKKK